MQLILGPWTHGDRSLSHAGEVEFGPAAPADKNLTEDFFELRRRWFDRWIKGVVNDIDEEAPVRVFVMGRLEAAQSRRPPGAWRALAQRGRVAAAANPLDSALLACRPEPRFGACGGGLGAIDSAFDPRDPVPTAGGAISSGEPVMHAGAFDQSAAALRSDVLVFMTPPLDHELEVTGPITVRLWIASDAPDTDFTAKLIDACPPSADFPHGFAMNLTEGLLWVRYRDSWERPAPMVPGEVCAITIQLFPIANLFCRGHRLRLDISSSNFPHFDVNPNSGEPEGECQQPRIAHNRFFGEAARPSHILLPSSRRASSIRHSVACPASVCGAGIRLRSVHELTVFLNGKHDATTC
jgi:putative CocE/NonD family hydrolase